MAASAPQAPRRGQRGAARAFREQGGDPRLRERHLRPVEAPGAPQEPARTPEDRPAPPTRQRASSGRGRAVVRTVTRAPGVEDGASLVLGVLAWVLTVNYLRGGMPQVKRWIAAKFVNNEPR